MTTLTERINSTYKTDYWETGKLYPKLNAYILLGEGGLNEEYIYVFSSCQFRTQKRFKEYVSTKYPRHKIKIEKGE